MPNLTICIDDVDVIKTIEVTVVKIVVTVDAPI